MENKTPSKIINSLYKRLEKLKTDSNGGDADKYDYKAEEQIKKQRVSFGNIKIKSYGNNIN